MRLTIPELSLVALIGASGSGKSTFARRHFKATEVLSSDFFRGLVSDDETDQSATRDAFDALYHVAEKRLANRRLTVIDATNVQRDARRPLIALARKYHCLPVAIVLDLDSRLCQERNRERTDRDFGGHFVRQQASQLRASLRHLQREGFRYVHVLRTPEEVEAAVVERQRLWTDRRDERGPFDVVGDVHGCFDELVELLGLLGWEIGTEPAATAGGEAGRYRAAHAEGRKLVFLGDLVDRGPSVPEVLRLAMDLVADGTALAVPGNHDVKLQRALQGREVKVAHGLERSLEQLAGESEGFRRRVAEFIDGMVSHYQLDEGRLVVAHAGMREDMQGRASGAVRAFALYGETTGETDEFGLPVRYDWARDYRGRSLVVYGHTPVPGPEWVNGTINIDTGCVFGGRLTALRYPEKELVSVPARRTWAEPARPPAPPAAVPRAPVDDDLLEIADVLGRRTVATALRGNVTLTADASAAALEAMSRFGADPRWLIYLPPTMAPSDTSNRDGFLEHPDEAFDYYGKAGVGHVVCQEKHMGSRAVVVVTRDEEVARRRFGVETGEIGVCITRTGRRFFSDPGIERALLDRIREAVTATGLWDELDTGWLCLDCELMPWSVKAEELLRRQYAPVAAAAIAGLGAARDLVAGAAGAAVDLSTLQLDLAHRLDLVERYARAYGRYCWRVENVGDLRLAPFHLLASEGAVHAGRDHLWHMEQARRLAEVGDGILIATRFREVELGSEASRGSAAEWWTELTEAGGEGMVVKPREFLARGRRGLAQPALKCRGREYLRIIYGPEYTLERHLTRLRDRSLRRKRALALQELALGLEALERFVRREPLRHVHECVFGVLALESEPVDARL
jgi:protein phosphatase